MASGKPVERRRSLRQAETVVTPGPAYWHLAGFSYNLFLSVDGALGIGRWSGLRIRNGRVGREMRHGGLHELRWLPDPPAYRFQRDALLIGEVSPLNLAHIAEREPGTGEDGLRLHDDKLVWQSTNFEDGSYHFEDVANSALQTVATLLAGK